RRPRKLLKVFLLDRLLQYENVDEESSVCDMAAPVATYCVSLPASRKRSPQLGGASSPSSSGLSLQATSGFPLQGSGAPSPYLSSVLWGDVVSSPLTFPPVSPLQMSLTPATHPDCSVVGGLPFSSPRGGPLAPLSSKLPPPTILSTVPQQMFSDAGEGSGEDPLDGDDELVIDIPE
uniref:INO80 complex subunit E n=1 Tax=Chelonoidis abingdonii TaxID=106734 RepID=A0A8C0GMY5_CHEAB